MKVGQFQKQPSEKLSKTITYEDDLDVDDYLETVDFCGATPAGMTVTAGLADTTRVRIWFEGGTDKVDYKVTVRVTTHGGEKFEDEITCKVREV